VSVSARREKSASVNDLLTHAERRAEREKKRERAVREAFDTGRSFTPLSPLHTNFAEREGESARRAARPNVASASDK